MKNFLSLSALGGFSTADIQQLCATLKDNGGNIESSRMVKMEDSFAVTLLISGNWDSIAKIEGMLPRLKERYDAIIQYKRIAASRPDHQAMPYIIDLVAADRPGIIYNIIHFIKQNDIHMQDMYTNCYDTDSGARMCVLRAIIHIPINTLIGPLRADFVDLCEQLNLDAGMEPLKYN